MNYDYNKAIETLPETLKKERLLSHMKQEDVAKAIHVNLKTYQKYEQGKTFPPVQSLIALCQLYKCEIEYLLGSSPAKKRETVDCSKVTGLSTEAIELLKDLKRYPWNLYLDIIDKFITWNKLPTVLGRMVEEAGSSYTKAQFIDSKHFDQIYNLYSRYRTFRTYDYMTKVREAICKEVGTPLENMKKKTDDTHILGDLNESSIPELAYQIHKLSELSYLMDGNNEYTDEERKAHFEECDLIFSQFKVLKYEEGLSLIYEEKGRRHEISRAFETFVDEYLDKEEKDVIETIKSERRNQNAEK